MRISAARSTRLRLIVADQAAVDDAALSALGARGIIRPSENAAQVVLGPVADLVAEEIRGTLAGGGGVVALAPQANRGSEDAMLPGDIAGALGGAANLRSVRALHGRYRVELADAAKVDEGALARLTRGLVRPQPDVCHILL